MGDGKRFRRTPELEPARQARRVPVTVPLGYGRVVRIACVAVVPLLFGCAEPSNPSSEAASAPSASEPEETSPSASEPSPVAEQPAQPNPTESAESPAPEPPEASTPEPAPNTTADPSSSSASAGARPSAAAGAPGGGAAGRGGDGGSNAIPAEEDAGSVETGPVTPSCTSFALPTAIAELEAAALGQLSGLVASRRQPGMFYAHVDAGAPAELFVFDRAGAHLGTVILSDLETSDWEDIAAAPARDDGTSVLFVGDIGDNAARMGGAARGDLAILRFVEPDPPSAGESVEVADWERIPIAYPEESHDAETLMYDPLADDLVLVTKDDSGASHVYRLPASSPADELVTLELVAEVQIGEDGSRGAQASAGDISPSGDLVLVRNYENALLWPRAPGQSLAEALASPPLVLETASEPQSEGISFGADGASWFSAGEQDPTLYEALAGCE